MIDPKMFPEGLTEAGAQERYAMMAYGEIRRRLKSEPNKKVLEAKFEELLKTQQTLIKHKGNFLAQSSYLVINFIFREVYQGQSVAAGIGEA